MLSKLFSTIKIPPSLFSYFCFFSIENNFQIFNNENERRLNTKSLKPMKMNYNIQINIVMIEEVNIVVVVVT